MGRKKKKECRKNMRIIILLILSFVAAACSSYIEESSKQYRWEKIQGRGDGDAVYRIRVPRSWKRMPASEEAYAGYKEQANAAFYIKGEGETIRVAIYTFPSKTLEERMTVDAQVLRWRRQFNVLEPDTIIIIPQSYGGFAGVFLAAEGTLEGYGIFEKMMLGWAMNIDTEFYHVLSEIKGSEEEENYAYQMRADYTIEAIGGKDLMEKHKKDIIESARTFELIKDIPAWQ